MQTINGFLICLSKTEIPNFNDALKAMRYRAWNGFDVRNVGNMHLGVCFANKKKKYDEIIHGEFYDSITFSREIKKLCKTLSEADGTYALAIPDDDSIIFARDALGTKPLYYANDHNKFLLTTDPNTLTMLGYKARCVVPGFLYRASVKKIVRTKFNPIRYETKTYTLTEAVETITSLLAESIKRRLANKKVVLGFGGGIDSTILAKLAAGNDILAVTVCTNDSLDYKLGKESADMLDVEHETVLVDEKTVKNSIRDLQQVMQFKNAMHASIACIVHILAKHAKENKMDALMLGQLADELFGGYARYLKYFRSSSRKAKDAMFSDVKNAYRDNFERDEIASSFYTQ
ncbi:MAG: asparagine synthase-related protein, partial [Nitrososphaerales archaeon]